MVVAGARFGVSIYIAKKEAKVGGKPSKGTPKDRRLKQNKVKPLPTPPKQPKQSTERPRGLS